VSNLHKKSDHLGMWTQRRFVFDPSCKLLSWTSVVSHERLGSVTVECVFIVPDRKSKRPFRFDVCGVDEQGGQKRVEVAATTELELRNWLDTLTAHSSIAPPARHPRHSEFEKDHLGTSIARDLDSGQTCALQNIPACTSSQVPDRPWS
jgi:hypothetical protein